MWIGGYCLLPLIACCWRCCSDRMLRRPARSAAAGVGRHEAPAEIQAADAKTICIFADDRVEPRPPEGTVARGHMTRRTPYYTGMEGEHVRRQEPGAGDAGAAQAGADEIQHLLHAVPRSDRDGRRESCRTRVPTWQPSNLTEDRVVQFADGDIFNVITNGRRTMPAYRFQIVVEDRWAIIAYVRVLQRAAHGTIDDVPAEQSAALK